MRALTDHEKRTVRIASVAIGIYLILFCGYQMWQFLEKNRADYRQVVQKADNLRQTIQPYKDKVVVIQKLMDGFHLDPAKLTKATVVGETSAAIQRAAAGSGVIVGPVREPPARTSSRELSLKLEGMGPIPAVIGLLNRMESVGYPVIIDEVQITAEASRPGMVKINLTITILDFEQWKSEEKPNA